MPGISLSDLAALFQQQQSSPLQEVGARMDDRASPQQRALEYQRMLMAREQSAMRTLNPGATWGGLDKMAIQPNDVMSNGPAWRIDNI